MIEEKGFKYSRGSFDEYKYRIQLKFKLEEYETILDIYTTNTDKQETAKVVESKSKEGVVLLSVVSWNSREYDDNCSKMIDEFLRFDQIDITGDVFDSDIRDSYLQERLER